MNPIHKITNANLFITGGSTLGQLSEAEIPKLTSTLVDHEALGLLSKTKHHAGYDNMEATFRFNAYYEDIMIALGDPTATVQLSLYANMDVITAAGLTEQKGVVVHMRAQPTTVGMGGTFKQMENVDGLECTLQVHYIKQIIGNLEVMEYDSLNNVHKVNGVDLTANYRNNLGL